MPSNSDSDYNRAFRDFVYLDVERVKSLLAQMEHGLLINRMTTSGDSVETGGSAGVTIPTLAQIGGKATYVSQNQLTETHSLHDHAYSLVEQALRESGQLTQLPKDYDASEITASEVRNNLSSVSYVLAKGSCVFHDYGFMADFISEYNDLVTATMSLGFQTPDASLPKSKRNAIIQQHKDKIKGAQLDKEDIKHLSLIMKQFYGNRVVIKIDPFGAPDFRVVSPLRIELLRDSLEDIRYKYGPAPSGTWTLLGQVTTIPQAARHTQSQPGDFSNDIDRAFSRLFDGYRGLERYFSISFPEIGLTPIAIYRE